MTYCTVAGTEPFYLDLESGTNRAIFLQVTAYLVKMTDETSQQRLRFVINFTIML